MVLVLVLKLVRIIYRIGKKIVSVISYVSMVKVMWWVWVILWVMGLF